MNILNIDLNIFSLWLCYRYRDTSKVYNAHHITSKIGQNNVKHIATGLDIWNENGKEAKEIMKIYLDNYAAAPTSTHNTEAQVKNANFCDKSNRSEKTKSVLASAQSYFNRDIKSLTKINME